jgi:hypothetical protein
MDKVFLESQENLKNTPKLDQTQDHSILER